MATSAGLFLYEILGGVDRKESHKMLRRESTRKQEPLLNPKGLKGSGLFYEYRTDDARLTLEVLKTAASFKAICLNYTQLLEFTYDQENQINGALIQDNLTQKTLTVKATCVINAAGPWSAALVQKDQPITQPLLYHTKGVHLVVPFSRFPLKQSVYFDVPGGRMLFAIPRHNSTYFGTTDTPFSGDLKNPEVSPEDASYLICLVNQMFPEVNLTVADITSSWAGVRPLIFEPGKKPTDISRKDEILVSKSGLITVAGGKLTGYRHLSEAVVNRAIQENFPELKASSTTKNLVLKAGNFQAYGNLEPFRKQCQKIGITSGIESSKIEYLIRNYGLNVLTILDKVSEIWNPVLSSGAAVLEAEIWYTIQAEATTSIGDFLIRRTGKLYFERDQIEAILPNVSNAFQKYLNLPEESIKHQLAEFEKHYKAAIAFKENTQKTSQLLL